MNLLYEDLARARCCELREVARQERAARQLLRARQAARLARRARRLAVAASAWHDVPVRTP